MDLFQLEIIEKQKERRQLRSKTGSKGSSRSRKGVRTPYDFLSNAEKKKLNGKVEIKNMYETLLTKQEFEKNSESLQKEILIRWRDIYPNQKIMEALEIKSNGSFSTLLERLEVPKKRSRSRQSKAMEKHQQKGEITAIKKEEVSAAAPIPMEKDITILDGLRLEYNSVYKSDDLAKIFTKLQLLIEGELNDFIVSIKLQERKK